MTELSYTHSIDAGTAMVANELQTNFEDIAAVVNGGIEGGSGASGNIAADGVTARELEDAAKLGLSESGTARRGKTIIATEETTTSTSYTTLTTPDRVSDIVLPTDGLIFVLFAGLMKNSAAAVSSLAVFLDAVQLLKPDTVSGTGTLASEYGVATPNRYSLVHTVNGNVAAAGDGFVIDAPSTTDVDAPASTGQVFYGGEVITNAIATPLIIQASAGTYDVSIQWKVASGTLSVKNRKLYVWTMDF